MLVQVRSEYPTKPQESVLPDDANACACFGETAIIAQISLPPLKYQEPLMTYVALIIPFVLFAGGIALAIKLTNIALEQLDRDQQLKLKK